MEIDLALLADAATVDGTGKLNILGIFDRISAAEFPAQHGHMALVLRFSGALNEAGNHTVAISLRSPDGQEMARIDGDMQLGPGRRSVEDGLKVPQVLNLDGVVFPEEGRYAFDVEVDGEVLASVALRVVDVGGARAQA